jgi:mono/diheme cytochrome c family protein
MACRWGLAVLVGLALSAGPAHAQTGNAELGREYSRRVCSECHLVDPGETTKGRLMRGPSFEKVAAVSGMSGMALTAWLTTSHPTMPNLILDPDRMDDVVAYILSLKPRAR